MGMPWFKMKDLARQHGIQAYSSNYALYGDMSNRVTSILRDYSPDLEVYSIDESFLRIETVAHLHGGAIPMGHQMRNRIKQWTGLPVCVGVGPTKTLAAIASAVMPKCLYSWSAGAEAPKVSMPITAPSRPTNWRQKPVTPASTATRLRTAFGSTDSR